MENIYNIKIGDIVLFLEGRDNKLIGHNQMGKVIIPVNNINRGYGKITKIIKNADKFILVEAENVVYDYYDDITYEEFKKVLIKQGYKIGFDREFETEYEYGTEHQIFAYDINTGIVIVAETFYGSKTFNSIEVYCPNTNGLYCRDKMLSRGSSIITVFDLCYNYRRGINALKEIKKYCNINSNSPIWENEEPSLWTYADKSNNIWEDTIDRILLCDKEIEKIFINSKRLKPIFNKRLGE